jgi:hypothetical protein
MGRSSTRPPAPTLLAPSAEDEMNWHVASAGALIIVAVGGCSDPWGVRALAADDFSCPASAVTVEPAKDDASGYAFRAAGCNLAATYVCVRDPWHSEDTRVWCDHGAYEGEAQPVVKPPPPTVAFPEGAAGLSFGSSPTDAGARCAAAGHVWAAGDHGDLTCDHAPAAVGIEASVGARFCADKLCGIEILAGSPGTEGWTKQFLHVRHELKKLYGPPTAIESVLPIACQSDLPRCLSEGKASFRVSWSWASRGNITLSMGAVEGRVALRISYERTTGPAL